MSYIGNTSTTQTYAAAIDTFNGDGVTTAFTLSRPVATVAQIEVVVNNVQQAPGSYTVSGNTLTFTGAPSSGTANIYVYYTSPVTQVIAPSTGTVGKAQLDIANFNGTGAMTLPTGTTAQRPGSPINGQMRYNSTTSSVEVYQGGGWVPYSTAYSIDYLSVAGGGAGAGPGGVAGAGGAGGMLSGSNVITLAGTAFAVVVGGGGSTPGSNGQGGDGTASSITATALTVSSVGGGGGLNVAGANPGRSGGSGGGGGGDGVYGGGSGTSGQGNNGGTGGGGNQGGGGGGGKGAVGSNGSGSNGGNGGAGAQWSDGNYYAGGGGGGPVGGSGGTGGAGGGGNFNVAGTANTGGGGGGYKNGGSGVVIIRYLGEQRGSGGTVTSSGGYTYHTFTTSGTFTA